MGESYCRDKAKADLERGYYIGYTNGKHYNRELGIALNAAKT